MQSVDQAQQWLRAQVRPLSGCESIHLAEAVGRVVAADILAPLNVPPHDNSAMDGYALQCADIAGREEWMVSQRIPAGTVPHALQAGTVARIFTGAMIPAGANAVVMQEQVSVASDGRIRLQEEVRAGQNIRRAGEDIRTGDVVVSAGKVLSAADAGLLASIGIATLPVVPRLRVGVFFTGDELLEPGQVLTAGKIYNSNRYWLVPELTAMGVEVVDLGIIRDSLDDTRAALRDLASKVDVIMTCGGVSVGEEDHVKAAVEAEGELTLWKIAIKPGKPLACGRVAGADFIGLPGNPVSGWVTFAVLIKPFLLARMGAADQTAVPMSVSAAFAWPRPDMRREEFLRGRLLPVNGQLAVEIYPKQGSGVLTSCAWADVLVRLSPGQTVTPGEMVTVFRP